jgi:hypothetical protein
VVSMHCLWAFAWIEQDDIFTLVMKLCYEELVENCPRAKSGGYESEFELDRRALQSIWIHSCKPLSNVSDVKDDVRMRKKHPWKETKDQV